MQLIHSDADTRVDAGYILCIDNDNRVLRQHSLLIKDGVITDICPTDELGDQTIKEHYCLPDHVVMPGLINAHGHASMALLRGIANDIPLQPWLEEHIWPAEGAWVSEEFVKHGAELAISEMIKSGTTTFSDMYFFPEVVAELALSIGMRAQLCCPLLDFPTAWGSGPDDYLTKTIKLHEHYKAADLIDIAFGPHAPYTVSDAPITQIVELAKSHGANVQMHIHETSDEVNDSLKACGMRPLARLEQLGLLDATLKLQAVHMTDLTNDEITLLAAREVSVIHCPESNMKLASGFCPTQALLDAGVNVALGTDGAASNNDLDMFGEMRTAVMIAKGYTGDASAVPTTSALRMATINGAKALGISDRTGSLELGKAADLIAIDMRQLRTAPSYDIEADLVYNTSSSQVSHTWVNGQLLLDCGRLTNIDEDEVIDTSKHWATKIKTGNN